MKILKYPDEQLSRVSQRVNNIDHYRGLAKRMIKTMFRHSGQGLAAPQVGVSKRIIVVNPCDPTVIFNPVISQMTGWKLGVEGCLSIPGYTAKIDRARKIRLTGQDIHGNKIDTEVIGILARIVQHECWHLDGMLINTVNLDEWQG